MSIIVTGGAGFIGSCLVRMLNDRGLEDILVVDNISSTEKWKNLRNKHFTEYIHKADFLERLPKMENITHIIHMGACSSTTEEDFDYLYRNNVRFSQCLWSYCAKKEIPFIYASSAATYGDGGAGFSDTLNIGLLRPLNGYGFSKQLFDLWAEKQALRPKQCVGLKFFNVYGPNEYCKGSMASMAFHGFGQIKASGTIRLFKSDNPQYPDGGQLRDFIYVKDICSVVSFLLDHPEINGLFNLGSGHPESFEALALSLFDALETEPDIQYIDMPANLVGKYQYRTQAVMCKLREAGYTVPFHSLRDGVADYVRNYLDKNYEIY